MNRIQMMIIAMFLRRRLQVLSGLVLLGGALSGVADESTLRVFVLAGQSNMEGQGVVDLDHPEYYNGGKGTLEQVIATTKSPERFAHLMNPDRSWRVRKDVFVRYRTPHELKKGGLSIGFAVYEGRHHIGPEFQLGHLVGEAFEEPVLLIKTAWGGKSLYKDFRPPSAGGTTGEFYKQMLREVDEALGDISEDFPELAEREPRIDGFVWFQGWNDMFDSEARAEYADNLVHLVSDLREAFKIPDLPIVIGELGNGGKSASKEMLAIRSAQASAAGSIWPVGSCSFVETHAFARPKEDSPNVGHGHHWFGNAESYFLIGDALGRALVGIVQASDGIVE